MGVLPAKGATFKLPRYTKRNIVVTAKLPKSNGTGAPFIVVDAEGGFFKDILPFNGVKFPAFKSKAAKSFVYVQAINDFGCAKPSATCPGLKFAKSGNLQFIAGATTFPGTNCNLLLLTKNSKGYGWFQTPFGGKVSKGKVSVTVPAVALANQYPHGLPKGPLYFNLACH